MRAADVLEEKRGETVDLLIGEAGSTFGKAQFEVSFTTNMLRSAAGEPRPVVDRRYDGAEVGDDPGWAEALSVLRGAAGIAPACYSPQRRKDAEIRAEKTE